MAKLSTIETITLELAYRSAQECCGENAPDLAKATEDNWVEMRNKFLENVRFNGAKSHTAIINVMLFFAQFASVEIEEKVKRVVKHSEKTLQRIEYNKEVKSQKELRKEAFLMEDTISQLLIKTGETYKRSWSNYSSTTTTRYGVLVHSYQDKQEFKFTDLDGSIIYKDASYDVIMAFFSTLF